MAHFKGLYLVFASIGLILCDVAQSQSLSTTTLGPTSGPYSCEEATPATINGISFLGTWFEAASNPIGGGNNSAECIQLFAYSDAGTIKVAITYSDDPHKLWINQTTTETINFNSQPSNSGDFEGVFSVNTAGVNTIYKILQTDYNSYALVCGYIPSNVPSSTSSTTVSSTIIATSSPAASSTTLEPVNAGPSGAFILTRERQINATQLANLSADAVANFTGFSNITTVTQSSECYKSGAFTTVPALAMIMAVVYSLLKFFH